MRIRYRSVENGEVTEISQQILSNGRCAEFASASARFRLAAGVAEFAELLRLSPYTAGTDFKDVEDVLRPVSMELSLDQQVKELMRLVAAARRLPRP